MNRRSLFERNRQFESASLQQRVSANRGSLCYAEAPVAAARFYTALSAVHQFIEDKLSWFDTADHLPGNRGRTIFIPTGTSAGSVSVLIQGKLMQKGIVVRCLEVHQCICDRKGDHGIEDQFHYSVHRQVPAASIYPREIREATQPRGKLCIWIPARKTTRRAAQ